MGELGGAERSLLDLMASLRVARPGWPLVLVAGGEGPLVTRAGELGVRTTVIPFPTSVSRLGDAGAGGPAGSQFTTGKLFGRMGAALPATLMYLSRFHRLIRSLAPDVVHSNGCKMHLLSTWAVPSRIPVIWHIHDYIGLRPMMSRLLRARAHRCAAAITNSCSVANDLRAVCGDKLGIFPIHNAIDVRHFSPQGPAMDLDKASDMPPAPPGAVRVGLLATMARWKGQEVFLRALSLLAGGSPVRGYILGGPLYPSTGSQYRVDELRLAAARFGIAQSVGFTGFVEDPAAAIRALDIVVHASTQPEPFGLVVLEGMACGKAVIASAAGGVAEIFADGVDAMKHAPGDAPGLAVLIRHLAANPALRARLGKAGRATVVRYFDRTRLADRLIPVYETICGGSLPESSKSARFSDLLPSLEKQQWPSQSDDDASLPLRANL